ncbi:beta-ketoacyl-ACP synthase [Spirulina sp. CS-785/01]|uniref:beta-ketoacyl-ACP synthase n=1 Tax=Spirulina sp. CS-785/01 TaxID=3021716 RepID=UPI00232C2CB6|nr:beta-ketoacyl-ACP synthase [Spirulina sp. CS-785/01]MDB9313698.1 beta-ketoacyl-ACP synthase [Spirulina sp. CS-785/01]
MDVVVTGIGLWSAVGNLASSWQQLLANQSGIQLAQPFPDLPPLPMALRNSTPSLLTPLVIQGVEAALQDAQLTPPLPQMGVVVGSSRGCQGNLEHLRQQPQPTPWLENLPHQGAITAAQQLQTQGPVFSPMAACATGIWAIARGAELIRTGECQQVLAGGVEAPISPLTLAGFERMGALAKTGCYPFDQHREGLVLGEGVALLVLESLPSAQQRHAKIYGKIGGFGLTADGYHVSAPQLTGTSARLAIQHCLTRSQLNPTDIDYIHAHGTSTRLNDANEAKLISTLFPPDVAVSSTKAVTGHTLGASGAIGVAFSLMALQQQVLPPCVGLTHPEFPLNLVRDATAAQLNNALCFSFGFGGQNAVISVGSERE